MSIPENNTSATKTETDVSSLFSKLEIRDGTSDICASITTEIPSGGAITKPTKEKKQKPSYIGIFFNDKNILDLYNIVNGVNNIHITIIFGKGCVPYSQHLLGIIKLRNSNMVTVQFSGRMLKATKGASSICAAEVHPINIDGVPLMVNGDDDEIIGITVSKPFIHVTLSVVNVDKKKDFSPADSNKLLILLKLQKIVSNYDILIAKLDELLIPEDLAKLKLTEELIFRLNITEDLELVGELVRLKITLKQLKDFNEELKSTIVTEESIDPFEEEGKIQNCFNPPRGPEDISVIE